MNQMKQVYRCGLWCLPMLVLVIVFVSANQRQRAVVLPFADGFDMPVGPPNADGYYISRGLRLRPPVHYGEDWNGVGGGDTDLGDPIHAVATGIVLFSHDVQVGWGNVVLIRHAYREPKTGKVRFCDSFYAHLQQRLVEVGTYVKRGQKIGTMGSNRGMYPAHLHFEMRHDLTIGLGRDSVPRTMDHWIEPRAFILSHRQLKPEPRPQMTPIGTFPDYRGGKGL